MYIIWIILTFVRSGIGVVKSSSATTNSRLAIASLTGAAATAYCWLFVGALFDTWFATSATSRKRFSARK